MHINSKYFLLLTLAPTLHLHLAYTYTHTHTQMYTHAHAYANMLHRAGTICV